MASRQEKYLANRLKEEYGEEKALKAILWFYSASRKFRSCLKNPIKYISDNELLWQNYPSD